MTQLYDYDSILFYGILDQNGQIVYDLDYPTITPLMNPLQAPLARTCKVGLYALWNIANACGISLPQPEATNPNRRARSF
jgi:hypothetical protein